LSLKESAERVKKRRQELKDEVRGTVGDLSETLPRPLLERKTIILSEPLLKRARRKLRERE
jgi:hypothetical protein